MIASANRKEPRTITMKDAETGKNLTFVAGPEPLRGLAVRDEVAVVFTAEGKTLRAASIKTG